MIVKSLAEISPVELSLFRYADLFCELSVVKKYFRLVRFLGVLLPSVSYVIYRNENVFPEGKRKMLLLRCFLGTAGLMLSFYAFQNMTLGDSSVIIFSTPVFVAIFSRVFLGEPCGLFNIFTIALTLLGIVFIVKPPALFGEGDSNNDSEGNYVWGPIAAIASAIFTANAMIIIRVLRDLHHSVVICNFGLFACAFTFVVLLVTSGFCLPPCENRFLVLTLSVFSFLGQILLTLALRIEEAGVISITRTTTVVFAFIWQVIFFNQIPCFYSIFGAMLIIGSVGLSALKKWALMDETNVSRNIARLLKM